MSFFHGGRLFIYLTSVILLKAGGFQGVGKDSWSWGLQTSRSQVDARFTF